MENEKHIYAPALWVLGLEVSRLTRVSSLVLGMTFTAGHGNLGPGFLRAAEEGTPCKREEDVSSWSGRLQGEGWPQRGDPPQLA